MLIDSDTILDVLGNDTRRRILTILSQEPMYFNQLAKEIGIGQQAVLRHMQTLEESGLITTYGKKSDLGAPDRKYYKIDSSFIVTISLSEDEFSVTNQRIVESRRPESRKFYNRFYSIPDDTISAISWIQKNLVQIDKEISDLESRINDLRALRQLFLRRLHEIGIDNFEENEREILYEIVKNSPKSIPALSDMLDQKESKVRSVITSMRSKMKAQSDAGVLFEGLR